MDKKVLFIVQNLPLPQDRRVYSEIRTMAENGWEVFAISPGNPEQKKKEIIDGVTFFRYPKPPKSSGLSSYVYEYAYTFFRSFYLALKIYFQKGFSTIHISNPPDFFFLIGLFFRLFGVKYIFDQHDLMPEMAEAKFNSTPNSFLYKALIFLEKMALKSCDAHIVTCQSALERIRNRHQFHAPSIIVKNAINYSMVFSDTPSKEKLFKVARFPYLCAYVGVMGEQDGVSGLLKSIEYIVKKKGRRDIGFVLMGDGDEKNTLENEARRLDIEGYMVFTGWADSKMISTYLNASDIGLMPEPKNNYTDNSLHNKILEYMAAGLPIVAYDLQEAKRAAEKSGKFVKGNEEDFGEAVLELLGDKKQRIQMSAWGKEQVEKSFNWKNSADSLLETYRLTMKMP